MSFRLGAAALAVGISIALSSTAFPRGGSTPMARDKAWFESDKAHSPAARSDSRVFACSSYFALAAPAFGATCG